ncbi:glycosyltransferase family 2 protein [Hansschlegelia sp. KR7-227]|uniref:glycosyltransferase family 2 protein n=1 Tax=Hansschlegelia sp. KR7-227 TaxID=3400914 RepID=UPI003C0DF58C
MVDLTIVICTYRRPEPLRRALLSVLRQAAPGGMAVAIVVADNSDDGSARSVVEALRPESPYPIAYVEAHPPNISVARNAGLAAVTSPTFAFIDDDEEIAPGWLSAVAEGLGAHDHDVFFGRVTPAFETPERATAAIRNLFSREVAAPAGHELFAMGPRKSPGITLGTNNSIFRTARALDGGVAFDAAYGHAGGEDYDLFCRLQARGLRFGWLPGAEVIEHVPADRCDEGYLRRRLYAGGQIYVAIMAARSRRPAVARWTLRAKAAAQAGLLALAAPLHLLRGPAARADYGFRWAGVLGKLSSGGFYPVYREGDAPKAPAA